MMQFNFVLLIAFAFKIILVHSELKDFISIDCGASAGSVDATTGIQYVPDSEFVKTGVTKEVAASYKTNTLEQLQTVRSFPQGTKNCYTLTPHLVNGSDYLVRAHFMYGNYDLKNQIPQFDLYLGVNYWTSVKFDKESTLVTKEIVNVSSSKLSYLCLANTGGGTPFISVLELRPLKRGVYATQYGSLQLQYRVNVGYLHNQYYRYPYDVFDRIWQPPYWYWWDSEMVPLVTNQTIDADPSISIDFPPPSIVMSTAVTSNSSNGSIHFMYWVPESPTDQYYFYFYFAEFQKMQTNQSRQFMIYLNDETLFNDTEVPRYLFTDGIHSTSAVTRGWFKFSIRPTGNSTLPPILNAFEYYTVRNLTLVGTNQSDVDTLKNISTIYKLNKNWQGDPCVPRDLSWEGVNCSNAGDKPYYNPRIIALDLSNNSLTGPVPDFFSQMTSLKYLNLSGNKLTGNVPSALLQRQNTTLKLSLENNPDLCTSSDTCKESNRQNKNKTSIITVVVAPVIGVLIIITLSAAVVWRRVKKRKQASTGGNDRAVDAGTGGGEHDVTMATFETNRNQYYSLLKSENQRFAYNDVLSITNNFEKAVGKGGFGTVYYGCIDATPVAVKMLSSSSIQGYRQFHAEVNLHWEIEKKCSSLLSAKMKHMVSDPKCRQSF